MKNLVQESLEVRARYDEEPSHSDQVSGLALQIFDALRAALKLNKRARELLQSAALLHDIGWSQTPDGRGHHKESARLIQEQAWESLTPEEIPVVAQIARYHRKSLPKPEHEAFGELNAAEQKLVLVLGGILRVADALDRTHCGRIVSATAEISDETVTIRVRAKGNWEAELAMFEIKRDLLEQALEKELRCEAGPAEKGRA